VSISRRDLARSPLTSHENDEQFPSFTRFSIGPQEKTFFFKNNFKLIFLSTCCPPVCIYCLPSSSFVFRDVLHSGHLHSPCNNNNNNNNILPYTRRRENSFLLLLFCLQQPQVRTQVLQVSPTGTNQQIELKYHKLMQIV
jgi:hypothetical protein